MKEKKLKIWIAVLICLLVIVIALLFGILIHDRYLDNKEPENNNIQDINNDNVLTGYTKLDVSKNNVNNLFEFSLMDEFSSFTLLDGTIFDFNVDNDKLYLMVNGKNYAVNINNPKKVIIKPNDAPSLDCYVLTEYGDIYNIVYDYSYGQTSNELLQQINNNISKISNVSNVLNIFWIEEMDVDDYGPSTIALGLIINDDTYFYNGEKLEKLANFNYSGWIKDDGTIKSSIKNSSNIIVKYIFGESESKMYFLDVNNYIYVLETDKIVKLNSEKVKEIYYNDKNKIIVIYDDGTTKEYSGSIIN